MRTYGKRGKGPSDDPFRALVLQQANTRSDFLLSVAAPTRRTVSKSTISVCDIADDYVTMLSSPRKQAKKHTRNSRRSRRQPAKGDFAFPPPAPSLQGNARRWSQLGDDTQQSAKAALSDDDGAGGTGSPLLLKPAVTGARGSTCVHLKRCVRRRKRAKALQGIDRSVGGFQEAFAVRETALDNHRVAGGGVGSEECVLKGNEAKRRKGRDSKQAEPTGKRARRRGDPHATQRSRTLDTDKKPQKARVAGKRQGKCRRGSGGSILNMRTKNLKIKSQSRLLVDLLRGVSSPALKKLQRVVLIGDTSAPVPLPSTPSPTASTASAAAASASSSSSSYSSRHRPGMALPRIRSLSTSLLRTCTALRRLLHSSYSFALSPSLPTALAPEVDIARRRQRVFRLAAARDDDLASDHVQLLANVDGPLEAMVKHLVEQGADVNWTDDDGYSALFLAVLYSRGHRLVQTLLKADAQPLQALPRSVSPSGTHSLVDVCMLLRQPKEALLLLQKGALPLDCPSPLPRSFPSFSSFPTSSTLSPGSALHSRTLQKQWLAHGRKHWNTVYPDRPCLISFARSYSLEDETRQCLHKALWQCVECADHRQLRSVLWHGRSLDLANSRNSQGVSPLFHALEHKRGLDIVQVLLEAQADPNCVDTNLMDTPMAIFPLLSSDPQACKVLRLLLEYGADPLAPVPLHLSPGVEAEPVLLVGHVSDCDADKDANTDVADMDSLADDPSGMCGVRAQLGIFAKLAPRHEGKQKRTPGPSLLQFGVGSAVRQDSIELLRSWASLCELVPWSNKKTNCSR